MAVFASTEQFYTCMKALFARVSQEDPGATDAVHKARLIIRLNLSSPGAQITVNGRANPVEAHLGPTAVRPDLDIELAADTLHQILLGRLALSKALSGGLVKVRGPLLKSFVLADLFHHLQAAYPAVAREHGLPT